MTPDSSVIVAAFAPWHERHPEAVEAIRGIDDLVSHAELEAYSVLTRLAAPGRAPATLTAEYLPVRFTGARLVLDQSRRAGLVSRLAPLGIAGGAVYDALIALTASSYELTLLTCDARAAVVYQRVGAPFKPL